VETEEIFATLMAKRGKARKFIEDNALDVKNWTSRKALIKSMF